MIKCPVCGSERVRAVGSDEDRECFRCIECGEFGEREDFTVSEFSVYGDDDDQDIEDEYLQYFSTD